RRSLHSALLIPARARLLNRFLYRTRSLRHRGHPTVDTGGVRAVRSGYLSGSVRSTSGDHMTSYRPLRDGWTVVPANGPAPAAVPGCVHTALLAGGLIPDRYLGDNEVRVGWIGRTDWRYPARFQWRPERPGGQVDLVCAGLDTVATVVVNGEVVGRTANMHR